MDEHLHNLTPLQINELTQLIREVHGFDFGEYTKASLRRRLTRVLLRKKLNFDTLKLALINDAGFFQGFLEEITVNVTEMFRDPSYYKALYAQVLPHLSTYTPIKIWSAGCSSGEEVYSLSILMREAALKDNSLVYGTDVNTVMLAEARNGIYSLRNLQAYAENYKATGLAGALPDNFTILNEMATIKDEIKTNTHFLAHNLIADDAFGEFNLISCRNVFIYFEMQLQEKILKIFYDSLCADGFLCLGSKETIRSEIFKKKFKVVNPKENIYQKITL